MGRPKKNITQENISINKTNMVHKEEKVENKPIKSNTKPQRVKIEDDEEIEIQSFDSNVTYWDKATDETYFWEETGEIILIPYSIVKNMWRNHKTYFKNFLLKPLDERVVSELGLSKIYEKYDFLMDGKQYTKENLEKIISTINGGTNGFKSAIFNNIKNMIVDGKISNIYIIKQLGKTFDIDFADMVE